MVYYGAVKTRQAHLKITQNFFTNDTLPVYCFSINKNRLESTYRSHIISKMSLLFGSLLLCSSLSHASLSAISANKIEGNAPYFTTDEGKTKIIDSDGLLGIMLSDGKFIIPASNAAYPEAIENTSTKENPIELVTVGETLNNVTMMIPVDAETSQSKMMQTVDLRTLINEPYHYWHDVDGDLNADATGSLTLEIEDSDGNKIKRSDELRICQSPYSVTLASTDAELSTQYGYPSNSVFSASSVTYYIKPKITIPYACYAQPNLTVDSGSDYQWDSQQGFKLQNLNTPSSNFPTIGASGLSFNLVFNEALNGTVSYTKTPAASNIALNITQNSHTLQIELTGPADGATEEQAEFLPTTFTVYLDNVSNKLYSFTIRQWFIAKPETAGSFEGARDYCSDLGYRLPSVAELTNANGYGWTGGLDGQVNRYLRQISIRDSSRITSTNPFGISGGLFSEWGAVYQYSQSQFNHTYYWAVEMADSSSQYVVNSHNGFIGSTDLSSGYSIACVSPFM